MMSVDDALRHRLSEAEREWDDKIDQRADITGDAEHVRGRLEALAEQAQTDEIICVTNTPDPVERRASFSRLAAVFAPLLTR